jgi:hypothetical protein
MPAAEGAVAAAARATEEPADPVFAAVDVAEDEPHPPLGLDGRAAADAPGAPPTPPPTAGPSRRRRRCPPRWPPTYLKKMRGGLDHPPPIPRLPDLLWSFVGAFAAILAVSGLDAALWGFPPSPSRSYDVVVGGGGQAPAGTTDNPVAAAPHAPVGALPVLVASFGASAVLLFGAPESKLSQPRGCVAGHVLSACVGVLARLALGERGLHAPTYVVASLGMALALTAMQLTRSTHPPGGATALIACTAPGAVSAAQWYGGRFVLAVAVGSVVMTASATIVNNLAADRAYPTYWWFGTGGPPQWCLRLCRAGRAAGGQKAPPAPGDGAPSP